CFHSTDLYRRRESVVSEDSLSASPTPACQGARSRATPVIGSSPRAVRLRAVIASFRDRRAAITARNSTPRHSLKLNPMQPPVHPPKDTTQLPGPPQRGGSPVATRRCSRHFTTSGIFSRKLLPSVYCGPCGLHATPISFPSADSASALMRPSGKSSP